MIITLDAVLRALRVMPRAAQAEVHQALARRLAPPDVVVAPVERRGRARIAPYAGAEFAGALRRCATDHGRVPTTTAYLHWRRRQQARARRGGRALPRLPSLALMYQRFETWERALAAASLNPDELAAARARRRPSVPDKDPAHGPLARLRALDQNALGSLGLTGVDVDRLGVEGLGRLPLAQALVVAHSLGGSLDWLGGRAARPGVVASQDASLDTDALGRLRRGRRLSEEAILDALDIGLGPWRRIRNGTSEPTLGQLLTLAGLLGVAGESLLRGA